MSDEKEAITHKILGTATQYYNKLSSYSNICIPLDDSKPCWSEGILLFDLVYIPKDDLELAPPSPENNIESYSTFLELEISLRATTANKVPIIVALFNNNNMNASYSSICFPNSIMDGDPIKYPFSLMWRTVMKDRTPQKWKVRIGTVNLSDTIYINRYPDDSLSDEKLYSTFSITERII